MLGMAFKKLYRNTLIRRFLQVFVLRQTYFIIIVVNYFKEPRQCNFKRMFQIYTGIVKPAITVAVM